MRRASCWLEGFGGGWFGGLEIRSIALSALPSATILRILDDHDKDGHFKDIKGS